MIRNTAGQSVSIDLAALADGTPVTTGTTTVYVTIDRGTQATGAGAVTHEGNGEWSYAPTQAETDGVHIKFSFRNSLAVGNGVNVYTRPSGTGFPAVGIGNVALAFVSGYDEFLAPYLLSANIGSITGGNRLNLTGIGTDVDLRSLIGCVATVFNDFDVSQAVGTLRCPTIVAASSTTGAWVEVESGIAVLGNRLRVFASVPSPSNFYSLGINSSGHVSRVTTTDTATATTTVNGLAANVITAASIATSALDGKGNWNIGKTGYALTAGTGLGNQTSNITGNLSGSVGSVTGAVGSVTGAVGSVTGNVGGNVVGSVGSISGITFPTNFASLGINASGHISRVTLVDNSTAAPDSAGTTTLLSRVGGTINVTDLNNTTSRWLGMVVLDGAVYQFTANALELAPAGGGGGGTGDASQATLLLVKAKTDLIQAGRITVGPSVDPAGQLTIQAGDDYLDSIGRALTWAITDYSGPSLTGGTASLSLIDLDAYNTQTGAVDLELAGTVSVSGTTVTVKVDATATQTASLAVSPPAKPWKYRYQLVGITSGSKRVTLQTGAATVRRQIDA